MGLCIAECRRYSNPLLCLLASPSGDASRYVDALDLNGEKCSSRAEKRVCGKNVSEGGGGVRREHHRKKK